MYVKPTALIAASIPALATACRQRVPSCQQAGISSGRNSITMARYAHSAWWSGGIDAHASSDRWGSWRTPLALRQCAENSRKRRYVTWQRSRLDLFTASRVLQKPNFAVLARV